MPYSELSDRQLYLELHELKNYGSLQEIKEINQELLKRKMEEI